MKLYLVRMVGHGELFYKIGVTHQPNAMHRFTAYGDALVQDDPSLTDMEKLAAAFEGHKYVFPYEVTFLHTENFLLEGDALLTEQEILDVVRPAAGYRPKISFPGASECFEAGSYQLQAVITYMQSQRTERNDAVPAADLYTKHYTASTNRDKVLRHLDALAKCRQD